MLLFSYDHTIICDKERALQNRIRWKQMTRNDVVKHIGVKRIFEK